MPDCLKIDLTDPAAPSFQLEPDTAPGDGIIVLRPLKATVLPRIQAVPLVHQAALGQFAIFEWTEYLLEGPALRQVSLSEHFYRFEVQNRMGQLRLTLITSHGRCTLPLAVLSPKFPTPETHLNYFKNLLEDLIRKSASLPFSVAQATALAADESPDPPTLLFVYHFLRQYGTDIHSALETILGNPHRNLLYEDDLVPLARVVQIDGSVLSGILTQPQFLVRAQRDLPIAAALEGYAPSHLWQTCAEETFDTPPNRFAKQFLAELADWSARLSETSWLLPYLAELNPVRDELVFAQTDPLWTEVGSLTRFPAENQVLLKRHGYRDWTDLWRRFHLARLPLFQKAQEAIDARDIATLYEVWCFFALTEQVRQILAVDPNRLSWRLDVSDAEGLEYTTQVTFGQTGYRLRYNESFRRVKDRSYSIGLRPDFTLHGPAGLRLIFDAKFRFDQNLFEVEDGKDEIDTQRTAKKSDLYKMHTYRDALRAKAAIVLYPGDSTIFYHIDARVTHLLDWSALISPGDIEWQGVGAIPMKPNVYIDNP